MIRHASLLSAVLTLAACATPASIEDGDDILASISPDGVVDLSAPIAPFILASGPQAMDLSPDGMQVAYRAESGGIPVLHVAPTRGGESRVLTPGQAVTTFAWYPDSSAVLFAADRDGNEQEGFYRLDLVAGAVSTLLAPMTRSRPSRPMARCSPTPRPSGTGWITTSMSTTSRAARAVWSGRGSTASMWRPYHRTHRS